jgi:hypothetical protein
MIAMVKGKKARVAWHEMFLAMLPAIRTHARRAFSRMKPESKEDLIQEVVANCLVAFVRLIKLGKGDLAFPSVLARFAIVQVRQGRRVGNRLNVQDALSQYAQHRKRFNVDRLDRYDETESAWQEILIEDSRCTPADLAASRLDFAAWLQRLPSPRRRIANVLASGERTGDVAKRFGMSAGRVSQIRAELRESWAKFQGELQPIANGTCAAA